jgi:hypothetical protein
MLRLLVLAAFAFFLLAALVGTIGQPPPAPMQVTRVPHPEYIVTSERGEHRNGVFDSAGAEVVFVGRWWLHQRSPNDRNCRGARSLVARSLSIFRIPAVEAITCTPSTCGGSYMKADAWDCPTPNCGNQFERFNSHPESAYPNDGYRFTGNKVCVGLGEGCRCEEEACNS